MTNILGIDEAGRGPVLGDMFIGGVLCNESQIEILKNLRVNDSKKLTPKHRRELYPIIVSNSIKHEIKQIPVKLIDEYVANDDSKSLNSLEMENMADIICSINPDVVIIDALGSNTSKFISALENQIRLKSSIKLNCHIIAENKADSTYTIVGAASIIAKVKRDALIDTYKKKYQEFGDIGSGYTSDAKTIEFLKKYIKKYKKIPPIARKSWKTSEKLYNDIIVQNKITEFF